MMNLYFYAQGESKNHGCEALVRSSASILAKQNSIERLDVLSYRLEEDQTILKDVPYLHFHPIGDSIRRLSPYHFLYKFSRTLFHSNYFDDWKTYHNVRSVHDSVALSIGGDNHCSLRDTLC